MYLPVVAVLSDAGYATNAPLTDKIPATIAATMAGDILNA
jgi:hypothetical protein